MDNRSDINPFSPPSAPLGMALGEERFYGLALQRLKLADWKSYKWKPLVWLNGILRRSLTPSADYYVTGVVNPNSPDDLKLADFEPPIKERLARQHPQLEAAGFQFAGFYNGPAFGLVKNLGELWVDDQVVCLNLLIQSIDMRRVKKVIAVQSLFSWRAAGKRLVTTNLSQTVSEDPAVDYLSLPDANLGELIRAHRQRVEASEDWEGVDREIAWWRVFDLVKYELRTLHSQGVLHPITPKQLKTLIDLSQFIDFRDLVVPTWVRAPLSRQVPVLIWLVVLLSVIVDRPVFPWALVIMPIWWLVVLLLSGPIFRYWMASEPTEHLSPRDYFHYLRLIPSDKLPG